LIQSSEKEHADLSGRSGRGRLVLVCAVSQTRPSFKIKQTVLAKSDFSQMHLRLWADQISLLTRSVSLRLMQIDLDLKKNATITGWLCLPL